MSTIAEATTTDVRERLAAEMDAAVTPAKPAPKRTRKPVQSVQQVGPGVKDPKPAKAPAKAPAKPAEPTLEEQETALRKAWDDATTGETNAKTLLDAAKIAWENTRVIRSRVAYAAAMLTPYEGGVNLTNAARILGTDPEDDAATRRKQAKSRKNSLRNYVNAGVALNEAGMVNRITEPDAEERKIVAEAFRAGNERPATDTPAGGSGEGEGEGEGASTPTGEEEALTFTTLLAHVSRMSATADLLIKTGVVVTEADMTLLAKVLDDIQIKLAVHAG